VCGLKLTSKLLRTNHNAPTMPGRMKKKKTPPGTSQRRIMWRSKGGGSRIVDCDDPSDRLVFLPVNVSSSSTDSGTSTSTSTSRPTSSPLLPGQQQRRTKKKAKKEASPIATTPPPVIGRAARQQRHRHWNKRHAVANDRVLLKQPDTKLAFLRAPGCFRVRQINNHPAAAYDNALAQTLSWRTVVPVPLCVY
jgi:hypothetical protein